MLTFNEKQLGLVKTVHTQIQSLETKQDEIYNDLLSSLNMTKHSAEEERLFDYIYNNFGSVSKKDGV